MPSPTPLRLGAAEFERLLRSPLSYDDLMGRPIMVDVDAGAEALRDPKLPEMLAALPAVFVGISESPHPLFDVCVAPDDPNLESLTTTLTNTATASITLALLLRGGASRSTSEGLVAESAAYSLLQAGPEFARWRSERSTHFGRREENPVLVYRNSSHLSIVLNRPHKHNAFDAATRDALCAAFELAIVDTTITRVSLSGNGPSFCSGGDLDEFGSRPDPASSHIIRLSRSAARLAAVLGPRLRVRLHGSCLGAGIELAAFAGHVRAHPDARLGLPELALGLLPGAGGTVSIPRRIGRQRCAYLAYTGVRLDARTALDWGLVDAIDDYSDDDSNDGGQDAHDGEEGA